MGTDGHDNDQMARLSVGIQNRLADVNLGLPSVNGGLPPTQDGLIIAGRAGRGGKHCTIFIGEQEISVTGEVIAKFVQLIRCLIVQHFLDERITVGRRSPGQIALVKLFPDDTQVVGVFGAR